MKISNTISTLFIPLPPLSRLQQLLYNQVIITSVRDTIDVEIFDRSTFLTELYELRDMLPMHITYFILLIGLIYLQKDMLQLISKDMIEIENKYMKQPYQKTDMLVKNAYTLRRTIRSLLFVFLFIFTKDVEHVS
jgi:hypothetical protein